LDYLVAGDGQVRVEGYGTVRIKLSRPLGEISIKLAKVALIPDFQTNTVSLRRLKAKGISWDLQNNVLTVEGKLWCQIKEIHNQFVIEYQPIAAFPADSRSPKSALHGTIERWHQRMGHLYEEAIKRLPQAARGVAIDLSKPLGTCETCRLSYALQQISR